MLFSFLSRSMPVRAFQPLPWRRMWILALWGAILLFSMAWEPSFRAWRELDWVVYRFFQELLVRVPGVAALFAVLNAHPIGNLIMDVAFAAVGIPWLIKSGSRQEVVRRLSLASYYVVVWKLTMTLVNRWFYSTVLAWPSLSPSLIDPPLVNLQDWAPTLNVKVFAEGTFPSDHAMQLLLLALVMATLGRPWGRLMTPVCLFFCLPRLISGAHWWSDVAAGGLGVALVAFVFWFGTPLYSFGMRLFCGFWGMLLRLPADPTPKSSSS